MQPVLPKLHLSVIVEYVGPARLQAGIENSPHHVSQSTAVSASGCESVQDSSGGDRPSSAHVFRGKQLPYLGRTPAGASSLSRRRPKPPPQREGRDTLAALLPTNIA